VLNHSQDGRSPRRWRLYGILVVCSVLPLILFLYSADRLLRSITTKSLLERTGPAADLAALVIEERMADAKASLESLSATPAVLDTWNRGDMKLLTAQLRMAHGLKRKAASLAVYDANGHLRAADPLAPPQTETSMASSVWFKTAIQGGSAYVSALDGPERATNKPAITVAVPINPHQPSGVLTATYTLDAFAGWTRGIAPGNLKWIAVVDQNGTVLAGSGLPNLGVPGDAGSRPEV
jgi:hypothetical protein